MRSTPAAARVSTIWSATVRVMIFSSDQVHCFDGYRQFVAELEIGEREHRWGGTRRFPSSRLLQRRLPIFDTENESFATDVKDHRRLMRPIDLAPKPAHMHVHEVALWNKPILPHLSEEHFTRKYPALATHHILEQAELPRQQINRAVVSPGRAFDKIELKRPYVQFCLRGSDRTLHQGFNQCAQFEAAMAALCIGEASEAVAHQSLDARTNGGGEGFNHLVCNRACHDLLLR